MLRLLPLLAALLAATIAAASPAPSLHARTDGGRISVDWKDAQLTDALRLIARVGGVNLVLDPSASGRTLTLALNDVPWQQALELACSVHGFGAELDGNVVRVAPLQALIQEQQQRVQHREAKSLATPLTTIAFPLSWTSATAAEPIVRKSLSPRGSIQVDRRTNTLLVTDAFEDPGAFDRQSAFFAGITIVPGGASPADQAVTDVSVEVIGRPDGTAIVGLKADPAPAAAGPASPAVLAVRQGDRSEVPGVPGLRLGYERDGDRPMLVLRSGRAGVAVPAAGRQAVRADLASGGELLLVLTVPAD